MDPSLQVGTRGSKLAKWQTNWVIKQLSLHHPHIKIHSQVIQTKGDQILDRPLSKIGDKGLFTKELDIALLNKEIDFAVHSLKDLPTTIPAGLKMIGITKREDPFDAFISKKNLSLSQLPKNATIATGSLRRKAQLLRIHNTFSIVDLRGNIQTRLKKLDSSSWDGIILAYAGLKRLDLIHRVSEIISLDKMIPAVGQGSLGILCRENDSKTHSLLENLNDPLSALTIRAERAFLATLEGGCQIPIGAYGKIQNNHLILEAMLSDKKGSFFLRKTLLGSLDEPEQLGKKLAKLFLDEGGKKILQEFKHNDGTF